MNQYLSDDVSQPPDLEAVAISVGGHLSSGFYLIYIPQAETKFATQRFVKVRE